MADLGKSLAQLRSGFSGRIVEPTDPGYDESRTLFNAMVDKRPRLIAYCSSVPDVQAALRFGREAGLDIAVRSGGHSVAGHSLNDDGLVIDLRGLNATEVDPAARTIRVGGGTNWGEFDAACMPHQLGATGGRVTTTGVAGLTLGGGSGWLERKWGLACDNLTAVELVAADGKTVRASDDENADLFWALHGGGGNFGIATAFEFKLHPCDPFTASLMLWDTKHGRDLAGVYREILSSAPEELGGGFAYLTAPPMEFVPADVQGTVRCGVIGAYLGTEPELQALIKPLLDVAQPDVSLVMPLPYQGFNGMLDDPPGQQNYWTVEYFDDLPDAMLDDFCDEAPKMKPSASQMVILPWGGAVARADGKTPMRNRQSKWLMHPLGVWEDPAENEERIAFSRGLAKKLRKYSNGGVYLNFVGNEGQERVVAAFGKENYDRLAEVKAEYDPDNVFRGNQNIQPAK